MANMSYCRFHNTHNDLSQCLDAVDNEDISSESELGKAKDMFHSFLMFCQENNIISGYDEEELEELLENAYKKEEDE